MRFRPEILAVLLPALLLGGCFAGSPKTLVDAKSQLEFLQDGKTTREEVLLALGVPARTFEGERILAYRLWVGPQGLHPVSATGAPGDPRYAYWQHDSIGLILVFDGRGTLSQHKAFGTK